jgi:hypothetical protein
MTHSDINHRILVLDQDYLTKRIVLDNITHYAYGQHSDGEVGVWIAGRAGWFSISPARGYRPMFNDVVEAIDLLYFLADRHQKRRRKRRNWNPSLDYLCEEVSGASPCACCGFVVTDTGPLGYST